MMNKRKLIMESNKLYSYIDVIPGQLMFVTFKRDFKPVCNKQRIYVRTDSFMHYEGFYNDFGPYNICNLYHYCKYLNLELENARKTNRVVIQYTWMDKEKRVNSAYAIGAFAIIYLNKTADEVYKLLTNGETQMFAKFNDASAILSEYKLSLLDCFRAIEKANKYYFFDFDDFNYLEYEHYEIVESGDLNWILPNKFIAFCGPHLLSGVDNKGYTHHAPDKYFDYFRSNYVTTIVRLNYKFYEASTFTDAGFQHYDLIFRDGSTPSDTILNQFLDICEKTDGAVAVHCKAGLGRTGSLIGAYIMKHYRFTAMEVIAWLRLCRPGSVIGHQQQWLEEKQLPMWIQGEAYRREHKVKLLKIHETAIYSFKNHSLIEDQLLEPRFVVEDTEEEDDDEDRTTNDDVVDDIFDAIQQKSMASKHQKRSRSVNGISEKVVGMNINSDTGDDQKNGNAMKQNDKNGNIIPKASTTTTSSTLRSPKLRSISTLIKKLPVIGATTRLSNTNTSIDAGDKITQGDELNQIKSRRAAATQNHHRSVTVAVTQTDAIVKPRCYYHNRAKSQTNTRSLLDQDVSSPTGIAKPIPTTKANQRFVSSSLPISVKAECGNTNTTITNSSSKMMMKSKQLKEELTTKRASVRRTTLGRSKLSRSPVKTTAPLTSTVNSVTTVSNDRVLVLNDDTTGPVTRSRTCRFCTSTPTDDVTNNNSNLNNNNTESNHKRGKRSLSTSRFHEKKNKLSRKTQTLPIAVTTTSLTRKLRKEVSLDSAVCENVDNSLSIESPSPSPSTKADVPALKLRAKRTPKVFSSSLN